jgi:hypothetical protein
VTVLTQAEMAKELGFWDATARGSTWTWQRCGRYAYRKCLTHLTNPDHLVSSMSSPTNVPPLRMPPVLDGGPSDSARVKRNASRPTVRGVAVG